MFWGPVASDRIVGKANVVSGIAAVVALVAAVVVLWPQRRLPAVAAGPAEQVRAAVEYLAGETLRYWRAQAKDRRITTPSPVAVRWSWASEEVAVPAGELWPDDADSGGPVTGLARSVLTAGVGTRLRAQLYDRLHRQRAPAGNPGEPRAG